MADEEIKPEEPATAPAEGDAEGEVEDGLGKPSIIQRLLDPKVLVVIAAILGGGAGAGAMLLLGGSDAPPAEVPEAVVSTEKAGSAAENVEKVSEERSATPPTDVAESAAEDDEDQIEEVDEGTAVSAEGATAEGGAAGEPIFFKMDPFVVNVFEKNSIHYLKMQMIVQCSTAEVVEELKLKTPQLRDTLIFLVSDMTMREILTPGGKQLLKEDIVTLFNKKIKTGKVTKVFFTEFTIQ